MKTSFNTLQILKYKCVKENFPLYFNVKIKHYHDDNGV